MSNLGTCSEYLPGPGSGKAGRTQGQAGLGGPVTSSKIWDTFGALICKMGVTQLPRRAAMGRGLMWK